MFYRFIKVIERKKLLTLFIKNIFNYDEIYDYNYLFRIVKSRGQVIIDIYDNISDNRFNRYVFNFNKNKKNINYYKDNVFVTYINVFDVEDSNNKLCKLGYLFSLSDKDMIDYARAFLDDEFVKILKKQVNL